MLANIKCTFFWHGFPACGHMLRDLNSILGSSLQVYATRPSVPFDGLGDFLANKIIYIEKADNLLNYYNDIKNSDLFVHTGWSFNAINSIDKRLKKENCKTKIFVLVDNRLKKNIRQFLGIFYMKFTLLKNIDGFIASGKSAIKLLKFLGVPSNKISSGHYGASSDLYPRWNKKNPKKDEITFIGSLDKRKGCDILINAWKQYKNNNGKLKLNIIGEGKYYDAFNSLKDVNLHGFLQPKESSKILLSSFCFILPGRDDNWATVIAEAAASGCILVSTINVAATEDLLRSTNGFLLKENTPSEILKILFELENLNEDKKIEMCSDSTIKSLNFDTRRLTNALKVLFDGNKSNQPLE